GLGGGARFPGGGLQVRARLLEIAGIHVGETAAVEALGVDLRHVLHGDELRESLDRLGEECLLLRGVAGELGRLVAHPGQVVGDDEGLHLGLAPALAVVQLVQVAVRGDDLVAQAVHPGPQVLARGFEVALQVRPHRGGTLAVAVLQQLVEALAPLFQRRHVGRSRRQPERRPEDERDGAASDHSEARAKPVAPASLARPSTRTTSPRTTWRSPARITTFSLVLASASLSTLASAPSSLPTGRSFT